MEKLGKPDKRVVPISVDNCVENWISGGYTGTVAGGTREPPRPEGRGGEEDVVCGQKLYRRGFRMWGKPPENPDRIAVLSPIPVDNCVENVDFCIGMQ